VAAKTRKHRGPVSTDPRPAQALGTTESDTSGHRRSFVQSELAAAVENLWELNNKYLRNSQILTTQT